MIQRIKLLQDVMLFKGLPADQLQSLAGIVVEKRFSRGQMIFLEGDPGSGFYVVATGKVKIFKASADGKEHILHIFGPGQPFGEVPVFSGRCFPASAQVMSASNLLFFPRLDFIALITAHPSLALNMLAVLAMRLREFTVQIENLSLKEVPSRLAVYLLGLQRARGQGDVVLPIAKAQLAGLLGTIPETLSRILGKMTAQDLISVNGRHITLKNMAALQTLAEGEKWREI